MKKISKSKMEILNGGNCFFTGLFLPVSIVTVSINPGGTLLSLINAAKCWNDN